VIHRDVKPGNLLVRPNGTLVLTDFGIARAAGAAQLTAAGSVLGTASYISPEQAMGEQATHLSDIYSLGVVAYQCLAGYRPFEGDNPLEIAMRHVREQTPALPPDVPPIARTIVDRAMAKQPAARWPTAAAFAQEARRAAAALGTSAPQLATAVSARSGAQPVSVSSGTGPALTTRAFTPPPGQTLTAGPAAKGPSTGTLVAIIVAVVLVAVCVGAGVAFVQQANRRSNATGALSAAYVDVTDSGGASTR